MDSSLNATFAMFVHPTLGLHAQTFGYNDFIDSAFVEGDVVLVQISNAGQISIKTANLPTTTIVDTITIAAGDSIVALGSMHPTNAPTITGQLAGSDLGSGIVPDVGYVAITTQAPAGLPAQ